MNAGTELKNGLILKLVMKCYELPNFLVLNIRRSFRWKKIKYCTIVRGLQLHFKIFHYLCNWPCFEFLTSTKDGIGCLSQGLNGYPQLENRSSTWLWIESVWRIIITWPRFPRQQIGPVGPSWVRLKSLAARCLKVRPKRRVQLRQIWLSFLALADSLSVMW